MKATLLGLLLLLSIGPVQDDSPSLHQTTERTIYIPPSSTGQACAVLDAGVYADAAGQSLNDLRLFAAGSQTETPFTLTESNTTRTESEAATVRNLGLSEDQAGNTIAFDLVMPHRPYTSVELALQAHDFTGAAHVWGITDAAQRTSLGTFPIFDLTSQHLARSTTLPLQESTFPELHIELQLHPASGTSAHALPASIVTAATVPPSRSAQTLYTTVASASVWRQHGFESVATLALPAHVPVARAVITVEPTYKANFLRNVTLIARPTHSEPGVRTSFDAETINGRISQVHLPTSTASPAIDDRQTAIESVFAANLHGDATVRVAITNGNDSPIPLRSVELQMRQRAICFNAVPGIETYTLMYGDGQLPAPVYEGSSFFTPTATPIQAKLGPEQPNPRFTPRADAKPFTKRHPQFFWFIFFVPLTVFGGIALRRMRHRREGSLR